MISVGSQRVDDVYEAHFIRPSWSWGKRKCTVRTAHPPLPPLATDHRFRVARPSKSTTPATADAAPKISDSWSVIPQWTNATPQLSMAHNATLRAVRCSGCGWRASVCQCPDYTPGTTHSPARHRGAQMHPSPTRRRAPIGGRGCAHQSRTTSRR